MYTTVSILIAIVLGGLGMFYWLTRKRRLVVGYVSSIRTHPVKSAKPLELQSANLTNLGIEFDRQFILVNEHGTIMTLRKFPKFVLIKTSIKDDCILLEAEGMDELKLPKEMRNEDGDHASVIKVFGVTTNGVHVSEKADNWFEKYFDCKGCKLYCFPSNGHLRHVKEKDFGGEKDTLMFADACPLLVLSEATVEDFNLVLDIPVSVTCFRPNIVVTGCKSGEEDDWGLIEIGETTMQGLFPCVRCVAITVNPETGVKDPKGATLNALKSHRPATKEKHPSFSGPICGFNYGVRKTGLIKVGDPVYRITT